MRTASPIWHVYIIECSTGTLYTGITTDLDRRFSEHQEQGVKCAKYLRGKGPLKMVYQEKCADRSTALKREAGIKNLSRLAKVTLINHQRKSAPLHIESIS